MSIAVIVAGILLIVFTNAITTDILMRIDPNPEHHAAVFNAVAGTGIVPAWVSMLHIAGGLAVVYGIVLLFAN